MADYKPLTADKVKFLIVHCAATRPSMDIGLKEIRLWHMQRGFFREGYHYIIRRDGTVEKGRPDDMPGAHVAGYNGKSLGICMVGGVAEHNVKLAENNFTPAQFDALYRVLSKLKQTYPHAKVVGHRDVAKGKDCPSFNVVDWWGTP